MADSNQTLRMSRAHRLGLEIRAVHADAECTEGFSERADNPYEVEIEHSKAVSLKRIADAMENLRPA